MSRGVVIVGSGVAGATAAQELRTGGYEHDIVLVGREPHLPYRRPTLSKDVLLKETTVDQTLLRPQSHWDEIGVQVRAGVRVVGGDTTAHTVVLSDGAELGYDSLVVATGATPRQLPGIEAGPRVQYLRDYAHARALRAALSSAGSVIVLGAGLIGSEVASAAVALGISVTTIEPAPTPLARVVPPEIGRRFATLQRQAGVNLLLSTAPKQITVEADRVCAQLPDGSVVEADQLVVAIGSVPDTGLADTLGLDVDDGIVTDERYRTSARDVYAIGDCARVPDPIDGGTYRAENWSAAQDQGGAVAQVLLGGVPAPTVPWGWSSQFGATLQFAGWPAADDEVEVDGTVNADANESFCARCTRAGVLVGAIALGRPKELRAARGEIAARLSAARTS